VAGKVFGGLGRVAVDGAEPREALVQSNPSKPCAAALQASAQKSIQRGTVSTWSISMTGAH
jgi:hypothetical protein